MKIKNAIKKLNKAFRPLAIYTRCRTLVNTDPCRRCYDGAHFSSELRWTTWELLEYLRQGSDSQARLKFWRELNDYAVSQRGEEAKRGFEIREQHE
jgi:hypothetical protein